MRLVAVIIHPDESGAHRARYLVRVDVHVDIEAAGPETEFVPGLVACAAFLAPVLALPLAVGALPLAIGLALHAVSFALLGLAHTLFGFPRTLLGFPRTLFRVATPLVVHRIECHVTGSFSRS
ncbi:MAG TPA: hypothetical protein VF833_07145 [Gaiellaceae bacterium]